MSVAVGFVLQALVFTAAAAAIGMAFHDRRMKIVPRVVGLSLLISAGVSVLLAIWCAVLGG